jgi:hypothetical protein
VLRLCGDRFGRRLRLRLRGDRLRLGLRLRFGLRFGLRFRLRLRGDRLRRHRDRLRFGLRFRLRLRLGGDRLGRRLRLRPRPAVRETGTGLPVRFFDTES